MARTLAGVLAGLLVLAAAGAASAGIPDPDLSNVVLSAGGLTTCPQGDGPAFQYITVTAKRSDTTPIQGISYTSFFFTVTGGDVTITNVGAETDANGQIQFRVVGDESISGNLTIEVQIYTVVLNDSDTLPCVTVDLAPNGQVVLEDFAIFGADYGTTNARSDFNWSGGVVNLEDFAIFGAHYGHSN
jgi:hypothetical protein